MTNDTLGPIIVADDEWPETQTGGEDSECDDIIVAGEPRLTDLLEWSE